MFPRPLVARCSPFHGQGMLYDMSLFLSIAVHGSVLSLASSASSTYSSVSCVSLHQPTYPTLCFLCGAFQQALSGWSPAATVFPTWVGCRKGFPWFEVLCCFCSWRFSLRKTCTVWSCGGWKGCNVEAGFLAWLLTCALFACECFCYLHPNRLPLCLFFTPSCAARLRRGCSLRYSKILLPLDLWWRAKGLLDSWLSFLLCFSCSKFASCGVNWSPPKRRWLRWQPSSQPMWVVLFCRWRHKYCLAVAESKDVSNAIVTRFLHSEVIIYTGKLV